MESVSDESRSWFFAFAILALVSLWVLATRLTNNPFLALDFEVTIVYLPTLLCGVAAAYIATRSRN